MDYGSNMRTRHLSHVDDGWSWWTMNSPGGRQIVQVEDYRIVQDGR